MLLSQVLRGDISMIFVHHGDILTCIECSQLIPFHLRFGLPPLIAHSFPSICVIFWALFFEIIDASTMHNCFEVWRITALAATRLVLYWLWAISILVTTIMALLNLSIMKVKRNVAIVPIAWLLLVLIGTGLSEMLIRLVDYLRVHHAYLMLLTIESLTISSCHSRILCIVCLLCIWCKTGCSEVSIILWMVKMRGF